MSMHLGTKLVEKMYHGSTKVLYVNRGTERVWATINLPELLANIADPSSGDNYPWFYYDGSSADFYILEGLNGTIYRLTLNPLQVVDNGQLDLAYDAGRISVLLDGDTFYTIGYDTPPSEQNAQAKVHLYDADSLDEIRSFFAGTLFASGSVYEMVVAGDYLAARWQPATSQPYYLGSCKLSTGTYVDKLEVPEGQAVNIGGTVWYFHVTDGHVVAEKLDLSVPESTTTITSTISSAAVFWDPWQYAGKLYLHVSDTGLDEQPYVVEFDPVAEAFSTVITTTGSQDLSVVGTDGDAILFLVGDTLKWVSTVNHTVTGSHTITPPTGWDHRDVLYTNGSVVVVFTSPNYAYRVKVRVLDGLTFSTTWDFDIEDVYSTSALATDGDMVYLLPDWTDFNPQYTNIMVVLDIAEGQSVARLELDEDAKYPSSIYTHGHLVVLSYSKSTDGSRWLQLVGPREEWASL